MHTETCAVQNNRAVPLSVWLEPWGMEYVLEPGDELQIEGAADWNGNWEVVDYPDCIGVYGWPTADIRIFKAGKLVEEWPRLTSEPLPGDFPVRQMVETLFGGPGGPKPTAKSGFVRRWLSTLRRWLSGLYPRR